MLKKTLILIAALIAVALALYPHLSAAAGSACSISVSGEGTMITMPDRARLTLGVEVEGATAQAAQQAMAAKMQAVVKALHGVHLQDADLQTIWIGLEPIRVYDSSTGRESLRGYRATNRLALTLVAPRQAGVILDAAVAAGANNVGDISYYLNNENALRSKALAKAVADARQRAQALAGPAGIRVANVISISEEAVTLPGPQLMQAAKDLSVAAPMEPGTVTVTARVRVRFRALG